jgi:predicted secreted hydrolase
MKRRAWLASLPALAWPGASFSAPFSTPGHASPVMPPVVSPDQALAFPRDFGAHPAYHTEWWYFTGALQSGQGPTARHWGFQITFFRSRVDVAQGSTSAFAVKNLIMAHAALTDLKEGKLHHEQRLARTGFGLAGAAEDDTQVKLRDWTLQRQGSPEQSRYDTHVATQDFSLSLRLDQTQPLILQGQAGYSRKGPQAEQATHYYSHPQLAVKGQLQWQGQSLAVSGKAWMDHEWGEALLAPDVVGWDWIGMNLLDGSALTAFRLRRQDGSTVWAGGSHRAPGQPARAFAPTEVLFKPGRLWQSPATAARYPVEWQVQTPVGIFQVQAQLDAQELDRQPKSVGNIYWEGLSQLLDAQGHIVGQGYLEMTGYAGKLVL